MPPPLPDDKSTQRVWPVASVMATGIFATTFVQLQGLGYVPFNHLLVKTMGLNSDQAATFLSLAILPWTFKAVAGLLVDGVPLLGSRRRSYLLLSALAAAGLWLAIGLAPKNYNLLLVLVLAMSSMIVLGSATSGGLLVEAGQKFGASGRLSSLRVFAQTAGNGLGLWLGGMLAGYALGWTSAMALVPLAGMFAVTWLLQREPPIPAAAVPAAGAAKAFASVWRQIKNVIRPQMLIPALLLFFIQAVPTFRSTCFYQYQTETLKYTDASFGLLQSVGCGVSLLSTGIYAWWCRKVPLRISLYGAILLTALSALPYLFYAAYPEHFSRALVIEGVGTFLQYAAYLPLMDLAVRSTPKGSEALGYSLLISVWNVGLMIGTKTGPMLYERVFHRHMDSLIWLNAGVTMAGALLVFALPRMLVEGREGK
jgi:predicted MFS family arabinose efflux permease